MCDLKVKTCRRAKSAGLHFNANQFNRGAASPQMSARVSAGGASRTPHDNTKDAQPNSTQNGTHNSRRGSRSSVDPSSPRAAHTPHDSSFS
eukprot:6205568-Pleurochrysis_carterae.AAC.3